MDLYNERDAVAALKAIAEAFVEQNKQNAEWMKIQTRWHVEEQQRYQTWRDEDVARLEQLEREALAQREAHVQDILADWKEQRKGEDYADKREA